MIFYRSLFFRALLFFLFVPILAFSQSDNIPVKMIDTAQLKAVKAREKKGVFDAIGEVVIVRADILLESEKVATAGKSRFELTYSAPGVKGMNLYFSDLYLPKGSTILIKGGYRDQQIGPLTPQEINTNKFATGFIYGEYVTLSIEIPSEKIDKAKVMLEGIGITNKNILPKDLRKDFGDAASCNINIGCEEGALWQQAGRSVVRILVRSGNLVGWCSGVLVNNTNEDFTPYILTAQHCGLNESTGNIITQSNFDQWVFYFNYELNACNGAFSPSDVPQQILAGADLIAHSDDEGGETGSDFLLLRLKNNIPTEFASVFAGWSNAELLASGGVVIHHPQGDVKKISTYTRQIESSQFSSNTSVRNTHWKVFWEETTNGFGITEGGSSGAPLFNNAGQVIGNLTGGLASCDRPEGFDLFGKVSYHWFSNGSNVERQLSNWLDPLDLEVSSWRSIDFIGNVVTSVDKKLESKPLIIYPNPTVDKVFINLSSQNNTSITELSIIDRTGKLVLNDYINSFEDVISIDVSTLQSGLYFISLRNNEIIYRNKLVIR